MASKGSRVKGCLTRIVVFIFCAGCWLVLVRAENERVEPKGRTIQTHFQRMGVPRTIDVMDQAGRLYLEISGPGKSILTFPSGSPNYLFDDKGNLVDWTSDSGDNEYHARWPTLVFVKRLTLDEGFRWPDIIKEPSFQADLQAISNN